jgi:alkyl sulfatase BDS1-like metallo-beta-lactamase superfamily hydrolase
MNISRREFLRTAGIVLASLGIVPASCQSRGPQATGSTAGGSSSGIALEEGVFGKDATAATVKANAAVLKKLPFNIKDDYELAQRGYITSLTDGTVMRDDGLGYAWNLNDYVFLSQENAPATVNPSLWRQGQINLNNGLFKVVDRVYQVRGLDLANMTILEGDTGLILIDPLSNQETARAALQLYWQQFGQRPVVAVIYTHTHADHWGGVKGVVSLEEVKAGNVQVLAPEHFLEKAMSENAYAGVAMSRRADYSYGRMLPCGERGQMDAGLGKAVSKGRISLIPPTDSITRTGETRRIDGVEIVFQMTPESEAPAEMTMFYPQFKVFNSAEIACMTMHNIYTPRGAEVRDANLWSNYLDEAVDLFGSQSEVLIAQHNWPRWGQAAVVDFLKCQRDLYKYIHDQTLRLANLGYTMHEIGEMITLPDSLNQEWHCHGYYGTMNHNAKAVYQRYLGWYDCNPANLNPLAPVDAGKKYVEFMGGEKEMLRRARQDFEDGQYRWVAQVMNHLVFAEPKNREAQLLFADAMEQLGYQAESSIWRNHYLQAAYELRNGVGPKPASAAAEEMIPAMTLAMFFDYLGIRLNGPKAEGKKIVINWNFTDVQEQYALNLENCALTYRSGKQAPEADLNLTLTRAVFDTVMIGQSTFKDEIASGNIHYDGKVLKLVELMGLMDTFEPNFNIVTP